MKLNKTSSTLVALALAAVLSTSAHAQSYNEGDILLGFEEPGSTNNYEVDLGAVSQFIGASSSLTFNLSTVDLTAAFGSSWANNTPAGSVVQWGLVGGSDSNGSTIVIGGKTLKEDTLFVTKAGTAPTVHGDGSQNTVNNAIQAFGNDFAGQTVTGHGGAITSSSSDSDDWSSNNPYSSAFAGSFGIEQPATGGSGPTNSTLNFYQLNNNTDTPGSTAINLGNFSLSSGGVLTFAPQSVPEPSSFALGSVAFALMVVLIARQRKGVSVE